VLFVLFVLIGGHRILPLRLRRCVSAPVLVVAGDGPFRRGNGSDGLNTRPLSDNIAIPGAAFRTAQQLAEAMTGSRSGLSCEVGRRGKELNLLPLPCAGSALPMSYAPSESLSAAWRNPLGPRWGKVAAQYRGWPFCAELGPSASLRWAFGKLVFVH
jgi:hypothetical protein